MKIKCNKCGYGWNYKGNSFYATCPKCMLKVRVFKTVSIRELMRR